MPFKDQPGAVEDQPLLQRHRANGDVEQHCQGNGEDRTEEVADDRAFRQAADNIMGRDIDAIAKHSPLV
ncbi:hypothetical protein [Desulfobulbus oligotrophicus]|uniref:Uncharacterized protein n=1 Tax=Desulfobulbus oligotrophicus TaxID=1909699 RepID=A0A7T5VAL3_9BACT|nr:hypothetical protein [Desulfobulbus oligotrophicus]QQG64351.1 hypothetical protein HP555_07320 [Desulfobulbus oligotrophicus]